ncbi:MAG: carbonic anhydrase [Prochlorotrichaceae cyanobacterium]
MKSRRHFLNPILAGLPLLALVIGAPSFAEEQELHWNYGGSHNPTHWGDISEEFYLCAEGQAQSPIDLVNAIDSTPATLDFNYQPVPLVMMNNGHTIEAIYGEGSGIRFDGETYRLLQFHFHTPSEHTIEGKAAAMELHLVHENAQHELAVVGVMIESGDLNPAIETLWGHIPETGVTEDIPGVEVDASQFLPQQHDYMTYQGSLTTPPCSEGVQWIVLDEPIYASEEQIEAFQALYPVNARPIQATHERQVEDHR